MWCSVLQVGVLLIHTVFSTAFVFTFGSYSVNPIRKDMAADVLQLKNVPRKDEFSNAHSWCTKHKSDSNYSVSSVCATQNPESIDYLVLFRRKHEVFTVSGLVRLHRETCLSTSDVFLMLRKQHDGIPTTSRAEIVGHWKIPHRIFPRGHNVPRELEV